MYKIHLTENMKVEGFILYTYNIFGCEWINSENTPNNNLCDHVLK